MSKYYVNRKEQKNGDHEIHKEGCSYFRCSLLGSTGLGLGDHNSCQSAVLEAKKHFKQVNGCYYCSKECHTQ